MAGSSQLYINGKFLSQKATGVQKFAIGVTLALQKKNPDIIVIAPRGKYNFHGINIKKSGWGINFLWEQIWLPLFFLFQSDFLLINFCNTAPLLVKRQIVTIHDLAFRKNKAWFSNSFRRWYNFLIPRLCKRSIKIITVSEFIKKEICLNFAMPPGKVCVVPNGIPEMKYDEQKSYNFKYLLLTGIYNPRKNATFILSQLAEIKKRNFHIVGVGLDSDIYGGNDLGTDNNFHLLNYVDDLKYYTLLKHAEALLYPSEYEGFGIPILEALSIGTPVIIPDIEVYRESFDNLPMYYQAGNANSFLQVLDNINVDKPTINELSVLKNKYTFDNSADIISAILKCDPIKNRANN